MQRLDSPLGKRLLALSIFCVTIGGWFAFTHYRDASQTLPDGQGREGPCALWFVGSSSIKRWTSLEQDMAPWVAHNRGINSATFNEILPRFANIEPGTPKPAAIILYAGENDLAGGRQVRPIFHDMARFLEMRTQLLGDVPVIILSMKPSPGRWAIFPQQQIYNDATRRLIPHMQNVHYADITTPLLKDGKLGDNYQPDKVHMNAAGYRIWADVVRARLKDILPEKTVKACAG